MSKHESIKVSDLNLGDVIRLFDDGYGDATVCKLEANGDVGVHRIYIHPTGFEYGECPRRIITYIGSEEFTVYAETYVTRVSEGRKLK